MEEERRRRERERKRKWMNQLGVVLVLRLFLFTCDFPPSSYWSLVPVAFGEFVTPLSLSLSLSLSLAVTTLAGCESDCIESNFVHTLTQTHKWLVHFVHLPIEVRWRGNRRLKIQWFNDALTHLSLRVILSLSLSFSCAFSLHEAAFFLAICTLSFRLAPFLFLHPLYPFSWRWKETDQAIKLSAVRGQISFSSPFFSCIHPFTSTLT